MISLKVKNSYGEVLNLSEYKELHIDNIDGLNPPDAEIVTNKFQRIGTVFSSSAINERYIVLKIGMHWNIPSMIELMDSYFFPGDVVILTFDDIWTIEGYVEKSERNRYADSASPSGIFQLISITCPYPYFKGQERLYQLKSSLPATIVSTFNGVFSPEITITPTSDINILILRNGTKEFRITKPMLATDTIIIDLDKKHCTQNGTNIYDACSGDWDALKIRRGTNSFTTPTMQMVATIKFNDHKAGL